MFTTTLKLQVCYNTCSRCPPLHCIFAASHCVISCCHCIHSCLFLIPGAASFMVFTNWGLFLWFITVKQSLPSCSPAERIKWVQVARSSGPSHWPISSTPFTFIIFIQNFSYLCEYMEVPCNVVATFVLVLQEAHPQGTEVVYFPESFWNTELLHAPQYQWSNQVIA